MFSAFQTFGKLGAIGKAIAAAWSPLALWPDGVNSPGMWIDPSLLTASFNDSAGTTPVATPGSVADSANPVGLALDIRAGAPEVLGPELVTNGDFSDGTTGWTPGYMTPAISVSGGQMSVVYDGGAYGRVTAPITCVVGRMYQVSMSLVSSTGPVRRSVTENSAGVAEVVFSDSTTPGVWTAIFTATQTTLWACVGLQGASSGQEGVFASISVREVPGNHMLQATAAARPLESAYDGQTLGPGNTYDATGYPIFQLYDGVDDGMATAAFSAGTLIDGMDCLIAVRRDSAAACVAGLYNGIADATKFFGMAESGSGSGCVGSGAGTPTVWVDGVQLSGGTAVTRGTLHTALTVGDWHILEFRGLDLSTWTAAGFGLYTSYVFPGARGDILLYPSTASTEDKDAARQYLADYYGVTLP